MSKRKIINIDQDKCNGCGLCIPNCPEGAIQMIDGKARLVSDLFCDGLGACLGHCPQGAIAIEEREAEPYSESKVMANIVKHGPNTIKVHLEHLKSHGEGRYLKEALEYLKKHGVKDPGGAKEAMHHHGGGCPGSRMMEFNKKKAHPAKAGEVQKAESELSQWPIQITLVPLHAPYFNGRDLLIAADCVPFAYADFHSSLLRGKTLLVGCPKLDDIGSYKEKLEMIFKNNDIKSVTYAHMEVPCCFGLVGVIKDAVSGSGKRIPFHEVTIGIDGERRA
jgi:NAD-dependent dihydropyrimidine dehydrogenase PreA subunit